MSTANDSKIGLTFSEAELKVLREKYARLTDAEFEAFLAAAHRYRLNPLANQIYARLQEKTEKNPRSVTYMAQIDGYRLLADRTGYYAGNDDPVYDDESKKQPGRATVTVYKLVNDQRVSFSASARWSEYCPAGNAGFMWHKMPFLMLGKCAEALALRKAFPAELSGLYIVEEFDQADGHDDQSKATPNGDERKHQQPESTATKLDVRGWPVDKIIKLVGVAEKYEQLDMLVDGAVDGEAWIDLSEREQIINAVRVQYKSLIAKKVPDVPAVTVPFNQKMKAHREKLELDKQYDELERKMADESKQKAEASQ
jgi:phage recombination protein Bet